MNYNQALNKLKHAAFGVVVENGMDPNTKETICYMLRFKGDTELEEVTESKINGRIVAVKSGSELYTVGDFGSESGGGDQ